MWNPVLNSALKQQSVLETESWVMSVNGTVTKTFIMLILLFISAAFSWSYALSNIEQVSLFLWVWAIAAFILVMVGIFKPKTSPYIAPIYALVEWFVLWVISVFAEQAYPWIVSQAILATWLVFFVMLWLYRTWVIKVTQKFRSVIISAIAAICLFYLAQLVLSLFGVNLISSAPWSETYWLSIWISVVVIVFASLSLLLDFDDIEKGSKMQLPKYYEWFFSIWIMVTIVWLYLEILELLAKLRD